MKRDNKYVIVACALATVVVGLILTVLSANNTLPKSPVPAAGQDAGVSNEQLLWMVPTNIIGMTDRLFVWAPFADGSNAGYKMMPVTMDQVNQALLKHLDGGAE